MSLLPIIFGVVASIGLIFWFWRLSRITRKEKEDKLIYATGIRPLGVTILVIGILVFLYGGLFSFIECISGKSCNFYAITGTFLWSSSVVTGVGIILLKKWSRYLVKILSAMFIFYFIKYAIEQPAPDGGSMLVIFVLLPFFIFSLFNFYFFTSKKFKDLCLKYGTKEIYNKILSRL